MPTGSHQRHWVSNVTTFSTTALLPSCFLSTQEVASACGVGGGVCEVMSGKREGTGGHSLPLRQPGARGLGRDGWPHQSHQRPNIGGAEEDGVGGAGPPVEKETHMHKIVYSWKLMCSWATQNIPCIMLLCKLYLCSDSINTCGNCHKLKMNALL